MNSISDVFYNNSRAVEGVALLAITAAVVSVAAYFFASPDLIGIPALAIGYTLSAASVALLALGVARIVQNFLIKT